MKFDESRNKMPNEHWLKKIIHPVGNSEGMHFRDSKRLNNQNVKMSEDTL